MPADLGTAERDEVIRRVNDRFPIRILPTVDGRPPAEACRELGIAGEAVRQNLFLGLENPPLAVRARSSEPGVVHGEIQLGLALSIVRQGLIRAIDPWTGGIVETSCCLSSTELEWREMTVYGYRFVGRRVFYLLLRGFASVGKYGLYLPDADTFISFDTADSSTKTLISVGGWRSFLVEHSGLVQRKILAEEPRRAVCLLQSRHFAHHLWNELSVVEAIVAAKLHWPADHVPTRSARRPPSGHPRSWFFG